ncbi:hypothetical protein GU90_15955 [Saccharopolyspora rectivirgula]|uniref:8-oxo-dGTP diphosphatase n=1 Tax=Saccharopolyspora rectivirgula TaxID=28042 RepID=A0A073AU11_9PSEU|nr:hypothetical protein GU90_15955 [Saccharopolyspora rectivirgula]
MRSTALIEAPLTTVSGALRHVRTAESGLAGLGITGRVGGSGGLDLLMPGDELVFRLRAVGVPVRVATRVARVDAAELVSELVAGPLAELRHEAVLAEAGPRTLLTDSVRWRLPLGALGRAADVLLLRGLVLRVLAARAAAVRRTAESWASRPVVVATAVVHNGLLLAQQREFPDEVAGKWELPGGRVEPGERETDAVVRECKEELDIQVRPGRRIAPDVPLPSGKLLRTYAAELADPEAVPRAVEHRAVRWVGAAEVAELDWLPADRVLVPALLRQLGAE